MRSILFMQAPDFEEVFGLNAAYAEKVYGDYLDAPDSVPAEWRSWFETELPPEQRAVTKPKPCLLYTSPSPRDATLSRMPSSA